jgi:hypothetical protein
MRSWCPWKASVGIGTSGWQITTSVPSSKISVGLASRVGAIQVDSGPIDPALRKAWVCFDHLAGEFGVLVFDSLRQQGLVRRAGRKVTLTEHGEKFCRGLGIDTATLERGRRPFVFGLSRLERAPPSISREPSALRS